MTLLFLTHAFVGTARRLAVYKTASRSIALHPYAGLRIANLGTTAHGTHSCSASCTCLRHPFPLVTLTGTIPSSEPTEKSVPRYAYKLVQHHAPQDSD